MGQQLRKTIHETRPAPAAPVRSSPRRTRGRLAQMSGAMAEDGVVRRLTAEGFEIVARNWRGQGGEIDIICRQGGCLVFVEVKQAATHAEAAQRLGRRQMDRICLAASEFCAGTVGDGLCEMRLDVALVDSLGRVEVLVNAFGQD